MFRFIMSNAVRAIPRRLLFVPSRAYFPERKLMKVREGKYFIDPDDGAERVIRVIATHDNVKDPSKITLKSTFGELGLSDLDMVEICLGIEDEFDIEFTDEQCESFRKIKDIVECVTTNQYVDD
eukprot:TRINITY_DN11374_c0_g1_i2.p2 TRINITY_DN11374_c0_g1~~TRINITY_DN11374_c0_g1_i2.p2  ORF type:complete len:124 (+),score=14.34 TRINITY_DN11374_c0_g1_i2:140-511(+)